ncbi:DUF4132 domain-containing protein [Endozoicomonas sp. G2_1]|uniref:DUF4132 domain-containing protein n=1 Tax=Endozoicomonas sp. G2_1 TaxID=2821091 RepID=UPI001AD97412|nr:DUF4132 domain-containing protein [Endozoicomonas sp. G2_1]MBO9489788.1 DUF4132 domain-containing protein [Endozoicomonas sp. G2_1]
MLEKILQRLRNAKTSGAQPQTSEFDHYFNAIQTQVIDSTEYLYSYHHLPFKDCEEYQQLKKLPALQKIAALEALMNKINSYDLDTRDYNNPNKQANYIYSRLIEALLKTRIDFPIDYSFSDLFSLLYHQGRKNKLALNDGPFGYFATQIEKHVKRHGPQTHIAEDIEELLANKLIKPHINGNEGNYYWGPDIGKAIQKLQNALTSANANGEQQVPSYKFSSGRFGQIARQAFETSNLTNDNNWNSLLRHLSTAKAGKPSKKFLTTSSQLIDQIGIKPYKKLVNQLFKQLVELEVIITQRTSNYNGQEYVYHNYEYIESGCYQLLKGLIWSMSRFHDQESVQNIAKLTEKCFEKIPDHGPVALAVGNAGIYTLAQSKGLGGIGHLSRLKLRVKQNSTQKLIQTYIDQQAEKLGIKPAQVEEISVPDFNLIEGKISIPFNDFSLQIKVSGVNQVEQIWLKPDGVQQKSVPAFVKNDKALNDNLKKARATVKQIKQNLSTQKDRIDRIYTDVMEWTITDFEQYYLKHGLVSVIAQKLIWSFDEKPLLYINEQWQDVSGNAVNIDPNAKVTLWHPLFSEAEEVLAWRERLDYLGIKQPIKQAFREIYLLTDAEINTRIYSNRMAAHIIKQHQFNSLAATRGWKYTLQGAFDNGADGELAQKYLPAHQLTAQFWINELIDEDGQYTDVGIWYYVATDQLRFCDQSGEAVELADVPPLLFSEIMRDADLFVGVASVGNDPQWQDGGPDGRAAYRDYWHSYSFGDLSEVAKTRKDVLEKLLPRLKLRDVAHIDNKFLIVKGTKHTYKIHIGSGNILIMPNDRYLCIVPSRSKDKNLNNVFLPFEGDNGLSIVLSKAFLLAEDNKIKDPTILSQL